MKTKAFEDIYHTSKLNKIKQWSIKVVEYPDYSSIEVATGYIPDGKMTYFKSSVLKGKNKGKKNETTHFTQAVSEAQSKWNKKVNQDGYSENIIPVDDKPIRPMLCQNYEDRGKDIVFPCYIQPKIDGLRGIYQKVGKTQYGIYSRLGNMFPHLDTIVNELKGINMVLDGELYYDGNMTFQKINGLVRKKTLNDDDKKDLELIKYIVYDTISDKDFSERYDDLKKLFKDNKFKNIILHKTEICKSSDCISEHHNAYVKMGYEGIIIRNKLGGYSENFRSENLQKFKIFSDAEYLITGFTDGKGAEKNAIIWECETQLHQKFTVRPAGSMNDRKNLYKNGKKYIGFLLTVKYQELTDDGIPRFPTTLYGGLHDIRNFIIV